MNYRREYYTVSKKAKCPEKRQTKCLCPLKGFLNSAYNDGKGLQRVTLDTGVVVGGQTWWMWISSVNGNIDEGLDGGGVMGWHGGDMTSQGFLTLLCVTITAVFPTHTHKHILENFLPSPYSTSLSALSCKGEVVKFIFPICHYGNQDSGLKKNTINHGIKIPYTYKFPLTTHALTQGQLLPPLDIENRKLDYMFNHQWLLNTDQIIKKARLYINNFLMQWLLMHRPYRLSIFKTWHDMCEVLRHSHGSVFSKVCWRLEEVKERVLLGWFNVKAA